MARRPFGGSAQDFVGSPQTVAGVSGKVVTVSAVTCSFWSAQSGGTRFNDLLDHSGSATTSIATDSNGQLPTFQGPADGTAAMWVESGGPTRTLILATDITSVAFLQQLVIQAVHGFSGQLVETFDEFGNPIVASGTVGGLAVLGDDMRVLAGGDVFNSINRLRSNGTVMQNKGDPAGSIGGVALGNVFTRPSTVPDGSHTEDGQTTSPGIVSYAFLGRPHVMHQVGTLDEDNEPTLRRKTWVVKDPGASTITTVGAPAAAIDTSSGSRANADNAVIAALLTCTTGTTSGNTAGISPAAYSQVMAAWQPMMWTKLLTDPTDVTSVRYWCGMFSADPVAISSPTGIHVMGFRYDTGVDGTAFWRCVTSAASATPTVTTTTVAVAAATKYDLRIEVNSANSFVRFSINGTVVATHTTTLPTFNQPLGPAVRCTTLTAAGKAVQFARWVLSHVG